MPRQPPWGICDRCGLKYPLTSLRREWTGLMVCAEDYDPRPAEMRPPSVRPEGLPLRNARPEKKPIFKPTPVPPPTPSPGPDADVSTFMISAPAPASVQEGNTGTTPFSFTVSRVGGTGFAAAVDWAVSGYGSNPASPSDFSGSIFPSGTVNFSPGQTSVTVTVDVKGDTTVEADEGFQVTISNGRTFGPTSPASQAAFILNDDSVVVVPPTLQTLALSASSIPENSAAGTVVGSILNTTVGSALTLTNNAGNRFAISGGSIVAGATATDYEAAASHNITIQETLAGAGGSPKSTTLSIAVGNLNDTSPSAFSFTDVTNVPVSTLETSNSITIAGLGASDTASATVSGDASSQVQKNGGAWTAGPVSVVNGDTLAVRHTSSGGGGAVASTTLTVGTTADTFTSTTATATISAPVLGLPSAANPPVLPITLQADHIAGQTLTLQWSLSETFASGISSGTHVLTNADIAGGTISGLGIPTLSGGPWYFRANVGGGTWSNTVAWGDAVAPTITTSATASQMELFPLAIALTASETVTWAITGGADAPMFEISGTTLRWLGNGTQNFDAPVDVDTNNTAVVQVTATDLGGNATNKTITVTTTAADKTPDAFSFTDVVPSTPSTVYTSNTVTISGLTAGVSVAATVSGAQYSKNGGSFTAAGSFTLQNGDTVALKVTSGSGSTDVVNAILTVGTVSDTWTVSNTSVTTTLTTTDGTSKNSNLAVSGSPALNGVSAGFDGNAQMVRATNSATGKKQVEVKVTHIPAAGKAFFFGIDDGSSSFGPAGSTVSGSANNAGVVLGVGNWGWVIARNSANIQGDSSAAAVALNDVFTCEFDTTAHTVSFFRNGVQVGTTVTGLGTVGATAWAIFGCDGNEVDFTANFGATAFTHTLSSGYTAYG